MASNRGVSASRPESVRLCRVCNGKSTRDDPISYSGLCSSCGAVRMIESILGQVEIIGEVKRTHQAATLAGLRRAGIARNVHDWEPPTP